MTAQHTARISPGLAGSIAPEVRKRIGDFSASVAAIHEAWLPRPKSGHTHRAHRGDVLALPAFTDGKWLEDTTGVLRASILYLQVFRAAIDKYYRTPKQTPCR